MRRLSLGAVVEWRVHKRITVLELCREARGDITGKTINKSMLLLLYIIVHTYAYSTMENHADRRALCLRANTRRPFWARV